MNACQLAARRQLLVATATLQRARLAHEAAGLRESLRPPSWAVPALAGVALGAVWLVRSAPRRNVAASTASPVWALRALTLWRALRALRRVWAAMNAPR
jgi:hypothetical protein